MYEDSMREPGSRNSLERIDIPDGDVAAGTTGADEHRGGN